MNIPRMQSTTAAGNAARPSAVRRALCAAALVGAVAALQACAVVPVEPVPRAAVSVRVGPPVVWARPWPGYWGWHRW